LEQIIKKWTALDIANSKSAPCTLQPQNISATMQLMGIGLVHKGFPTVREQTVEQKVY